MLPDPTSQARSAATSTLSNLSSQVQRSKVFISSFLYVLLTVLGFGLLGLAAVRSTWGYPLTFGLLQLALLGLGALYAARLPRWLPWLAADSRWQQGLALLATAALGGAAIWGLRWLKWAQGGLPPTGFVMAVIPFLLPFFFWQSYLAWRAVPHRQYKLWRYNPLAPGPDLSRMDLSQFMVVHFWMTRRYGEALYHDFSSKAPHQMRLHDLFAIFLTDYNQLKPDQALQYVDGQGQAYGWLFYAKRPWWRRRHYYDPDLTFQDNFLRQGSIIVAQRVPWPGAAA
ncbi:MAG TPA: TssN family type VI secretion system protein [Hymenobacter sp.]|uniref:TssN family type VI secretion system protein n=1 Tax=Hymenobacter sp. TaxID=1898978 RepID=UPI002D7E3450|nr:TssN family type VI secretion system protein [Hymenobacter sp.]HET9505131.1 TssN family type VI secretion system protein [Hymenobacter sp.]